jgi:S1-C subfamily serine protease/predicted Fe-Mo cluster-binding NifX family protein
MNKGLIYLGPVTVLAFVVVLAIMYGWVGTVNSVGSETRERPEMNLANQVQTGTQPDNLADKRAGQPEQGGRLVHHGRFPVGIGNNQIQLINKPTFPAGIGNGQIQLINKPTFPAGIGNGQIQLINKPTFPVGIGNGQIQLINQNRPGSPYLGLSLGEVNGAVAGELKLPPGTGAYVHAVVDVSPAQKAGVKAGDVLLKCDHKAVNNPEEVGVILGKKKAGDVIKLVVNRNGRKRSFHVKLENPPMGLEVGAIQNPVWMGADIQDIDAVMKIQFNLPDNRGVIVSHVAQNSPAAAAGLRTGDVIRRFGTTRLRDVKQLQSLILGGQPGQQVQLTILRNGQHQNLELTLGQEPANVGRHVAFLGPADVAIEGTWIGMDVTELSAGDASALGLQAGTRGILVNDVESPPATMVGFQTGDVIVAVNGHPTPDMKQFETATRRQSGAVVDVIRGNRHLLMSVPPPGFTQQGTKLNTGLDNKMRQVAMVGPIRGRLAIFASGPDLNSCVAGNSAIAPYVILVDFQNNSYAAVGPDNPTPLPEIFRQYNVTGLVCSDVSIDTANILGSQGVVVYSGVAGTPLGAVELYEMNQLTPMRRF